jgi:hypothetical protein
LHRQRERFRQRWSPKTTSLSPFVRASSLPARTDFNAESWPR